jgi:regulatory protein
VTRKTRDSIPSDPSPAKLRTTALRLLGRRDYTSAELRQKLADRGFAEEDIDAGLARLTADGLIDDQRVAAAFLRTASRIKGRGPARISRELRARGIDRDVVDALVSGISDADQIAAIDRFLLRRRSPNPPSLAERRRIFQQLLRRGFSADAISRALRARGADVDDE